MDAEVKEGTAASAEINKELTLDKDPALVNRVTTIGNKLAAIADVTTIPAEFGNDVVYPFHYHFFVVKSPDVNAFSLPGGFVYVNTGLLDAVRSDDELAGVLSHEITHAAHHHVDTISHIANSHFGALNIGILAAMLAAMLGHGNNGDNGNNIAGIAEAGQYAEMGILNNDYSEQAERDADHGGMILMQKAGYNPVAMLTFMMRLGDFEDRQPQINQGIFTNHPPAKERISLLHAELAEMHVPITTPAVRAVSGGFRATVAPGVSGTHQILFNNQPLATLADPDGKRAQDAADTLNTVLDQGLQMFQVEVRDSTLMADSHPLITFTPADAALAPGLTPEALATQAEASLKKGLWAQSFVVADPSTH